MIKKKYRGYTIQEDYRNPYSTKPEYMYYPAVSGIQHDADLDGEDYRYCGNCGWADSLGSAKDEIHDLTLVGNNGYKYLEHSRWLLTSRIFFVLTLIFFASIPIVGVSTTMAEIWVLGFTGCLIGSILSGFMTFQMKKSL